jgi:hypothetical protein
MPSLDELSNLYPVPPKKETGFRELFIADFGDITGTFMEKDTCTEFHTTFGGKPVVIVIYRSPGSLTEYTINGNSAQMGDLRFLTLEQRQEKLLNTVRFYLR